MELEASDPPVRDESLHLPDAGSAAVRVDRGERNDDVGMLRGELHDLVVADLWRLTRRGGGVDREGDTHHVPLPVVLGEIVHGGRDDVGTEVREELLPVLADHGRRVDRRVDMRVDVDGGERLDLDGHGDSSGGNGARAPTSRTSWPKIGYCLVMFRAGLTGPRDRDVLDMP